MDTHPDADEKHSKPRNKANMDQPQEEFIEPDPTQNDVGGGDEKETVSKDRRPTIPNPAAK